MDQSKLLITIDLEWVDRTQEIAEPAALQVELVVEHLRTLDNLQTTPSTPKALACTILFTHLEAPPTAVVHQLLVQLPLEVIMASITIRGLHQQIEEKEVNNIVEVRHLGHLDSLEHQGKTKTRQMPVRLEGQGRDQDPKGNRMQMHPSHCHPLLVEIN